MFIQIRENLMDEKIYLMFQTNDQKKKYHMFFVGMI